MKKIFKGIFLTACSALFLACGSDKPAQKQQEKIVIKMGYGTNPGHPIDLASQKFKEMVEKKSDGKIEVRLFPSAQLGSERQLVEGLKSGTIEMTPTTTGPLGLFDKSFFVFDVPYIFKDEAGADKVLDGEIGQEMLKKLENQGIIGLAFWENGFRQITNSTREIRIPEDLRGIKLRTMENEVHMKYFSSLKATPTPLGFGEIYMALRSKTVDGQENPLSIIATNNFYEVQKYTTKSDHVYSPVIVLISKIVWDKMSPDQQKIVKDSAWELRIAQREMGRKATEEYLATIEKGGSQLTILSANEKKAFMEATDKIIPEIKDLIDYDLYLRAKEEGWK